MLTAAQFLCGRARIWLPGSLKLSPSSLTPMSQLATTSSKPCRLTFLVLEPQLLLDLLVGEVNDAGELEPEGLCDVV